MTLRRSFALLRLRRCKAPFRTQGRGRLARDAPAGLDRGSQPYSNAIGIAVWLVESRRKESMPLGMRHHKRHHKRCLSERDRYQSLVTSKYISILQIFLLVLSKDRMGSVVLSIKLISDRLIFVCDVGM